MSFELTYAKRAMQEITSPEIEKALGHICKAIKNLQDENKQLKQEIRNVAARIHP